MHATHTSKVGLLEVRCNRNPKMKPGVLKVLVFTVVTGKTAKTGVYTRFVCVQGANQHLVALQSWYVIATGTDCTIIVKYVYSCLLLAAALFVHQTERASSIPTGEIKHAILLHFPGAFFEKL